MLCAVIAFSRSQQQGGNLDDLIDQIFNPQNSTNNNSNNNIDINGASDTVDQNSNTNLNDNQNTNSNNNQNSYETPSSTPQIIQGGNTNIKPADNVSLITSTILSKMIFIIIFFLFVSN